MMKNSNPGVYGKQDPTFDKFQYQSSFYSPFMSWLWVLIALALFRNSARARTDLAIPMPDAVVARYMAAYRN